MKYIFILLFVIGCTSIAGVKVGNEENREKVYTDEINNLLNNSFRLIDLQSDSALYFIHIGKKDSAFYYIGMAKANLELANSIGDFIQDDLHSKMKDLK